MKTPSRSSRHRRPSASHEPWRAAGLRKGRLYGVPREAIERAEERRLAGDWRGACAAAGVHVDLDPGALRRAHGSEFTERLLDDLRHLVPDLARLHLPRSWKGVGLVIPGHDALLSRPGGPEGPWLTLGLRDARIIGDQRPTLAVQERRTGPDLAYSPQGRPFIPRTARSSPTGHWRGLPQVWETARHLWDSRHTGRARERWGGDAHRVPFLDPDGTPRKDLPSGDPGPGDPVARAEWIDGLHQAGRVLEAFAAAGIGFAEKVVAAPGGEGPPTMDPVAVAARLPLSPARLAREVRHLAATGLGTGFQLPVDTHTTLVASLDGDTVRVAFTEFADGFSAGLPVLPDAFWTRPPDVDVLRDGMSPDELHPLVREAIAPDHVPGAPPEPAFADRTPVRVRCQGEWHAVAPADGGLDVPHTDEEWRREESLRGLGGSSSGCFAVAEAWTSGRGRLPRELRRRRDDLFERVRHGDTGAVVRYLDGGGAPGIRDASGRTLLHHLRFLDHEVLLPRLLAAGLDVDTEDDLGRTPLYYAAVESTQTGPARSLVRAGARTRDLGGFPPAPGPMFCGNYFDYWFEELDALRDTPATGGP
ncbi:ankyrin repeat domain-containing protein [Nocardiopsis flavescens]|nr:ankyrin repeat domain-containing protein [Nocardiopsis flavescens]